jgi:multiple sugar transport system permease protein
MTIDEKTQGPVQSGPGLETLPQEKVERRAILTGRLEHSAPAMFVMPAVVLVLFISILPLILSLYLSLVQLTFVPGGFKLNFVGLQNYANVLFGMYHDETLGAITNVNWLAWLIFALAAAFVFWLLARYIRSEEVTGGGLAARIIVSLIALAAIWLVIFTIIPDGRPGALTVTLLYVFVDITVQYALGLLLAILCTQHIPGRRFFRVVFLIPMMITPVGVAYLFRMLTDTVKGPFLPIWNALGLANFSWVTVPWGARAAVMIGDTWQWTPFMFIVLVAALESQSVEHIEAAYVDGANSWQVFRYLTLPDILPVSMTLVLIRMIEAFKIVDLPNVLTNGGPGTATESLTLQAYIYWRNLDIGSSAAVAYILLFVVTFVGLSYVNLLRSRAVKVL